MERNLLRSMRSKSYQRSIKEPFPLDRRTVDSKSLNVLHEKTVIALKIVESKNIDNLSFYGWRLQKNKIRFQDLLLKSTRKLIDLEENQKGKISMELSFNVMKYVDQGEVEIEMMVEKNHLFVFYSDTGPGMVENSIEKTGLVLSNIRERARILGGKATMNSSIGKGTTWNITMPLN
ncbi:MAG: hypothetical protein Q8867_10795 [Bacteroidota bacterium]|nr:hypothetical protein [Bacteroidota bacterium]